MIWKYHHISKIYEALGAIGDNRIEFIEGENEAKMYSSSKNKFYTIMWNDALTQMIANDNSAFFARKLSYPMIAVLMLKKKIKYPAELPEMLKGIKWKDINQKFKNNFDKTVEFVIGELEEKGLDIQFIKGEIEKIDSQVKNLKIEHLGKKMFPPKGY